MKLGVHFPLREIGLEFETVRRYVETVEGTGYDHIRFGEHVLGANAATRPQWTGLYDHTMPWHEPFVLFAWMSHFTKTLEFVTGTMTLPQRQTALVAKQAAQIDLLLGGRLRLGVAVGWNSAEFEALGMNFHDRGERIEEQIEVLRLLWTQELVVFNGKFHTLSDVGINPLPVQRPIPVWIGGGPGSPLPVGGKAPPAWDRVLRRVARLADGWFPGPMLEPDDEGRETIRSLRRYIDEAGRSQSDVGIQAYLPLFKFSTPAQWREQASRWKDLGCTHMSLDTIKAGLSTFDAHCEALERFYDAVAPIVNA